MQQAYDSHARQHRTPSILSGAGMAMLGLGFLVVSATGSAIAWQTWGNAPAPDIVAQAPAPVDLSPLIGRITVLTEENRVLRAELDSLSGPGGVLPRIITQLQEGKRLDAAHGAALQQLLSRRVETSGSAEVSTLPENGFGPVQVTPIRSAVNEQPQRVVVTPSASIPPEGQGQ